MKVKEKLKRTPEQWQRFALALDMHLDGMQLAAIAEHFGVSKQRVHQMIIVAKRRLAYRVFGTSLYIWNFDRERGLWRAK
jgi:predicted DNA-binding protein YlxM (UPF0122 family)